MQRSLLVNRALLVAGKVFRLPDADLSDLGDGVHVSLLIVVLKDSLKTSEAKTCI